MTDVRIVKRKEKDGPDKYWHVVCSASGASEGSWGELRDAIKYCESNGYTYELATENDKEN